MRKALLGAMILAILISACGGSSKKNSPKAVKFIPTAFPVQAAGWQGVTVHTLCLVQNYNQFGSYYDLTNFKKEIRIIFARMGLNVVDAGQSCDATLTITITGQAQGAFYLGLNQNCYTGSAAEGDFTLSAPGRDNLVAHVSHSQPTPESTYANDCPDSDHAPYLQSLIPTVLDGMAALYGPVIYGWILVEEGEDNGCGAPNPSCGGYFETYTGDRFGPGANAAVPALIVALDSPTEWVRTEAAYRLQTITGQSFGTDKKAWEAWWASSGGLIPTGTGPTSLTSGTSTPTPTQSSPAK